MLSGSEFEIVSAVTNVSEAMAVIKHRPVRLIMCEFKVHDEDTMVLVKPAIEKNIPVLIFTGFCNPVFVSKAVELGVYGMVQKTASKQVLLEALQNVVQGKKAWKRQDMRRVTGALATSRIESEIDIPLTKREFEVLQGVSKGLTNKLIAEELKISYETVKEHVQHILRKMGVNDRTQAAVTAARKGLI